MLINAVNVKILWITAVYVELEIFKEIVLHYVNVEMDILMIFPVIMIVKVFISHNI